MSKIKEKKYRYLFFCYIPERMSMYLLCCVKKLPEYFAVRFLLGKKIRDCHFIYSVKQDVLSPLYTVLLKNS